MDQEKHVHKMLRARAWQQRNDIRNAATQEKSTVNYLKPPNQ